VCDNVLKPHSASDLVLFNRAKGLLLMGAIFKSTVPDETDAERRELERMVAEAATGKSKHHQMTKAANAHGKKKEKSASPPSTPAGIKPPPAPAAAATAPAS